MKDLSPGASERECRGGGGGVSGPSPCYTNLCPSRPLRGKAQVQRVLSLTWGTRLVRGQGSVHSSHGPYSLGQSSPPRPWGQWVPGGTPGVPNAAVAGTGPDTPTAPLEGAHGAGESQGLSTSATPAPGLSCALAPILPRQHSYFYSLQFSVGSPCVCVAGGGGAGNGTARGVGGAGGAHWATGVAEGPQCPSKGRLPPAPRRPPCPLPGGPAEMHSAKAARVTRPHSVFELVYETRCQPLLHPHRWEKGMAQFRHWGNDIPW